MPVSHKLNKTQRRELVRRARSGENYTDLADDFGITNSVVSYHATRAGVRRLSKRRATTPEPQPTPRPTKTERLHLLVAVPKTRLGAVLGLEGVDLLDISAA